MGIIKPLIVEIAINDKPTNLKEIKETEEGMLNLIKLAEDVLNALYKTRKKLEEDNG